MPTKLSVLGGGVMGEALISRLVSLGTFTADAIAVGDPSPSRRQFLMETYGVRATGDNDAALAQADIVLVAVKPQIFDKVTPVLQKASSQQQSLLLSIMAGIPLVTLETVTPNWPIIRAMPNTPATVGAGMTAIAPNQLATDDHLHQARSIFAAVGDVVEVPESLIDAVTGLSGSGPGYVAIVIEALADGGVAAGLPRATALQLAIQTVKGTAELLQKTDLHPAVLKDRVTSPGGTTIAGIAQLEAAGLRSALIEAVQTACDRAKALGS
ncbi:pyrroline-5-carboxylate reductase [Oscillatoria sp. CS-180]|uniref:pyrroline-5-carboxylate reductase n=1 Tax=Oscillatoria sp. CS-180 TaxID=3021720 RepID=UPI00232D68D0|nr:pyrroline-5-carboxylate reductase [Oscillatoria sp. CS-180]MDB9528805.1 pyrroline-5-carboxylate reductase [Oscillatoria sp. CS-180]